MSTKLLILGMASVFLGNSIAQSADRSTVPIADFGFSIQTVQDGFFRCIGGRPDQVADQLVTLGQPKAHAWRIDITAEAASRGAGVLIPLFDETNPDSPTLRIGRSRYLSGRFLGQLGSRRLRVELLTTRNPEGTGLQLSIVDGNQLEGSVWKPIRLTIAQNRDVPKNATYLRILAEGEGPAWFAVDSLALSSKKVTSKKMASKENKFPVAQSLRKAIWFWDTEKTLTDQGRTAALLSLCRSHGVTDLYCQIPYSYEDNAIQLRLVDEQRDFNTAAQSLGITTHALDGSPEYVFPRNHPRMIRLIEALGQLNEQGLPNERYRAVHLDNEPYVLPGWKNDDERRQIIQGYIELNQKLRHKTDALGMEFGVDIPFWWDERDRKGTAKFTYDTEAGKQPILEALFPLLDNVGIMSYRVRVTGPNGLVAHCLSEFKLGQEFGVDVFASAELGVGENVDEGTTFGVYPWTYFRSQLSTLEKILSHTPGCAGLAIHHAGPFAQAMK